MMQRLLFPSVLLFTVVGAIGALRVGVDAALLPTLATIIGFAVVLPLERLMPRVGRVPETGEHVADVSWFGVSTLVDAAAGAVLTGLAVWVAQGHGGLLSELTLVPATFLVVLLRSFGDYWAHRLAHEVPWLWRFHAVHHAPHRMVSVNNPRLHPADLLFKRTLQLVPAVLLGLSGEAIALVGVLAGLQVAFQHADLDLRHGWLNRVFATNSVHRWHHSSDPGEANANYGGVWVFWDQVFGTYRVPPEQLEPAGMGLFASLPYPIHQPLRAFVAPLCWARCTSRRA